MKHNIFQFEQNFLAHKPKPIDLFLFSLPLKFKVRYSHETSVFLVFQASGQLKVQFVFSLCLHTGCTIRCIFHKWRLQAWVHGCVIPAPALLRVMVGTLACYKMKFCPRRICKRRKNYNFTLLKRIHSKAENSMDFNMWSHIEFLLIFSSFWILGCLEST